MAGATHKHAGWKRILSILLLWSMLVVLVAAFVPLFYAGFAILTLALPPIAYLHVLHEKFESKTPFSPFEELRRLLSYLGLFPLMLAAATAVLRSLTLFLCSLFAPALTVFQRLHYETVYPPLISLFGDMAPYWLDLYWGAGAVAVFLVMAIYGAWHRSLLVRQIKTMPTSKVKSAAIGLVELKGRALPVDPDDAAPIIRSWTEIRDNAISTPSYADPFYLDDGSGRVLVDPRGCSVNQSDSMFSIGIHQVVLKQRRASNGFSEGRLIPGEAVYVFGNLRINQDPDFPDDAVVVKPEKSTLVHPRFNDVFFVTDKPKNVLLDAFHRVSRRGWLRSLLLFLIAGWIAIYAWTNIAQISAHRLDAAPLVFRLLSPSTDLSRGVEIEGLGRKPVIEWLDRIAAGSADTESIMHALRQRMLAHLALPALGRHALDIESAGFARANHWLDKLGRTPPSFWGYQFFKDEHVRENIGRENNHEAFVYRVALNYDRPLLTASWKAWISEFESDRFTLTGKHIVFHLTHAETGRRYLRKFPLEFGWNTGRDERLFRSIPPGRYTFECFVSRSYAGGGRDRGSRSRGEFEIHLR